MGSAALLRPIDVSSLGLAATGATVWRMAERLQVTVFVKATFEFVPDAAMIRVPPEEILTAEVHHNKNPMRSVRLTPDVAPYLPLTDVLLTGHACAPEGTLVTALSVRLAVFRGEPLLDKTIHVHGDAKGEEIAPFDRMPLMYERAYGGIGWEENPLGAGFGAASSGKKPNLLDPLNPNKPACFAPISRGWPLRKRLLGGADRRALDRPIVELPAGFDWSYYQAAPEDQRIGHLQGDEWIILDGLHPVHGHLQSYLPGARGLARVYGMADGGAGHPLRMVADTLRIDTDQLRCTVVWRGSFPIPQEDALAAIRVVAGVETSQEELSWPAAATPASPGAGEAAAAPGRADHAATVMLGDATSESIEVIEDVTDLARTFTTEDAPSEGPVWQRTITTDGDMRSPTLPFVQAPPASAAVALAEVAPKLRIPTDTVSMELDVEEATSPKPAPPSLPFQRPPPPPPPSSARPPLPRAKVVSHGIELVNPTGLAFDVIPWALVPARDCLTVIAKASCDLIPGAPVEVRAEAEPIEPDRFEDNRCVYPSDYALYKVKADVTLSGHASAQGGEARVMEVLFNFGGDAPNSFTRRLLAFGVRHWERGPAGARPSAPGTFFRIPLCPALAFGGPRFDPNPVGIGYPDPMRRRRTQLPLPHIEDPERRLRTPGQTPPPVFPSPIPMAWKERWARLGRSRSPWPCLAEELDWTHYQAAPQVQQLSFLGGDEEFTIAGVHPSHPVISGALPGVVARCFVAWSASTRGGAFEEVPLNLDTATFEIDRRTLSLVFRGTIGVPDERATGIEALYLIKEQKGEEPMTLAQAKEKFARR